MTIKSSGSLSLQEINAEFGLGTNLNAYRGTQWYTDAGGSGTFNTTGINFGEFYSKRVTKPIPSFSLVQTLWGENTSVGVGNVSKQAGDLLFIVNSAHDNNATPADVAPPSGYVTLWNTTTVLTRDKAYYKISNGTESNFTGLNSNRSRDWVVFVIRPSVSIASAIPNGSSMNSSVGIPTPKSVSASGIPTPIVVFGVGTGNASVGSVNLTDDATSTEIVFSARVQIRYVLYNVGTTPVNHTFRIAADTGAQSVGGLYFTFT